MPGFGTGFSSTFVPSGKLAIEREKQDIASFGNAVGGRSTSMPTGPIGGVQNQVTGPRGGGGGGGPALAPALVGADVADPNVHGTMMDKRAEREGAMFDNGMMMLMAGDGSGMTDYFTKNGSKDLDANVNVGDDGSVNVDFMNKKTGKRTGGKKFKNVDEFYLKFAARAKPKDFRGKQVPIASGLERPEFAAEGNEYQGLQKYDKTGAFQGEELAPPIDPALLQKAGNNGTRGGGVYREEDYMSDIQAANQKIAQISDRNDVVYAALSTKERAEATKRIKRNLLDLHQGLYRYNPRFSEQNFKSQHAKGGLLYKAPLAVKPQTPEFIEAKAKEIWTKFQGANEADIAEAMATLRVQQPAVHKALMLKTTGGGA
jgi:hypothetical protein